MPDYMACAQDGKRHHKALCSQEVKIFSMPRNEFPSAQECEQLLYPFIADSLARKSYVQIFR